VIVLRRRPNEADDLLCHELCHVWQMQHLPLRVLVTLFTTRYERNPFEAEARWAVLRTEAPLAGATSELASVGAEPVDLCLQLPHPPALDLELGGEMTGLRLPVVAAASQPAEHEGEDDEDEPDDDEHDRLHGAEA
jgi:hypothetical protein